MAGVAVNVVGVAVTVTAIAVTVGIENLKTQLLEFPYQLLKKIVQNVQRDPMLLIYGAAFVTFPVMVITTIVEQMRKLRNTILLVGVSGSGKTVLYNQLRDGFSHQGTVTSMEPNEDTFVLHSETTNNVKIKPVHVIDVPGHSSLLPEMRKYLCYATGVVFVVDAPGFAHNYRQVAEYLYKVLTMISIISRRVPILILCNKTERYDAVSNDFIREQLEKEIEKLRTTRAADPTIEYIGVRGQAFNFQQCVNNVTVARASALTGEISAAEMFIREHVKP